MPTKFPELFLDSITLEKVTVTKFLGVMKMSHQKPTLPQFQPRFLKA